MTKKVRYIMSSTLLQGCQRFSDKALNEGDIDLTHHNLATLIFGYTSIEARINELDQDRI